MVTLNRIYTKSGDGGDTGLGDGSRVRKNSPRIAVCGSIDELNAVLGLLVSHAPDFPQRSLVERIQNDLFDLGADLCVPISSGAGPERLRVSEPQVAFLEQSIDRLNARLEPLSSFVIPGGSGTSAWCHFARTVCRRAERELVSLMETDRTNPEALKYLNRLSDLLFVLARIGNDDGRSDVLWVPGAHRK